MRRLGLMVFALGVVIPAAVFGAEPAPVAPAGYGALLFQTMLVLAGVCALAFVSLRWGLRRFVSADGRDHGAMQVVARLPVEPRRSVLVVKVGARHLILGSSEAGFQALGELDDDEALQFQRGERDERRSFGDVLAALRPNVSRETLTGEDA